eukprot:TRINITY_DN55552_c0_g2_i1.p1 TRINITY_DN55552_c0_g2~~TRINITY_DN55552_c0_g2_i1.p1  ORF type:complete len:190 (-),score=27.25 TRINITY_DN55552_c0_g2_i1:221-790(-)
MGGSISNVLKSLSTVFGGNRDCRILMIGLDGAGKTTLLYKLKLGEVVTTIPTIGFNVETVKCNNLRFIMWDIGGQDKLAPLLSRHYYEGSKGVIFVVDCNDIERVHSARDKLHKLMAEEKLRDTVLLVFANKQDLPNAINPTELGEQLGVCQIKNKNWFIQGTCATTGEGILEGLDWLANAIKQHSSCH